MGDRRVVNWLRVEWGRAGRRKGNNEDNTGLLEARSAAVALAVAGDSTHLHDFVDHMTDGPRELANLNYWAYWIGELNDLKTSDAFMLDAGTRSWVGARLLQHLVAPTGGRIPGHRGPAGRRLDRISTQGPHDRDRQAIRRCGSPRVCTFLARPVRTSMT
jgi:hypothetical protein